MSGGDRNPERPARERARVKAKGQAYRELAKRYPSEYAEILGRRMEANGFSPKGKWLGEAYRPFENEEKRRP